MIILFIFHICRVGEVSWGWSGGEVVVSFSCWRHLTDAVVCVAPGPTVSQGMRLFASWLLWRDVLLLFFSRWGFCHSYSRAALWQRHEITCNYAVRGWGQNPNVVKRIGAAVVQNNWEKAFVRMEMVTLSWAVEEMAEQSPQSAEVNMESCQHEECFVVLLSGNKRSHHSLQNIKNNAVTEPAPQQPGEMNHPEIYAFHGFGLVLAFWHLLKLCQWKDWNTVHHETTELFIIVDY